MRILDAFGFTQSLKEDEHVRTADQSAELISEYIKGYEDIIDFKNHKKYSLGSRQNIFRFTIKLISLDFLGKLAKDKRVKNVMFSPSTPPPGGGLDSISMRYKVYIEYR